MIHFYKLTLNLKNQGYREDLEAQGQNMRNEAPCERSGHETREYLIL